MSLRTKAILGICIAVIASVGSLYATSRFILMNGLSRIENYQTEKNAYRVFNFLTGSLAKQESGAVDWAIWDDTYAFMSDANQAYIDRNLMDSTFSTLNLNLMLFIDPSGKIVFGKAFDLEREEETGIPPQLLDAETRSQIFGSRNATSGLSGIIMLKEGPMMVAAEPILKSDYTGMVKGTLLFGRFLDAGELNGYGRLTLSDIAIRRIDNPSDMDFRQAMNSLIHQPVVTQILDSKTIAGYILVRDIHGDPAFILRTSEPRDAYILGQSSIVYFIVSAIGIGLLAILTIFFVADKQVMSRFNAMLSGLNKIIKSGDTTVRIPASGNDELTLVARTMNGLLASLEESSAELRTREERYRRLAEDVQKLYQEEKRLREELQAEINKRIEYTHGLVHELKTPITPILAASELLLEEIHEPPLDNLVKSINRSAESLNRRIDELLDIARSEVSMLSINVEPVDINAILNEVLSEMNPVAQYNKHSLITEIAPLLPWVDADKDRIRQVVLNLLNNAIKYTPSGGEISLNARRDAANLIISVSDTGPGMSVEQKQRLFEPYYRVADIRQKLSGLGLGLYLSKSLVQLHGGSIWADSEIGKGSTFSFSLPIERRKG